MQQVNAEKFTESVVEDVALAWLESLGYAVLHGPGIASDEPALVAELVSEGNP